MAQQRPHEEKPQELSDETNKTSRPSSSIEAPNSPESKSADDSDTIGPAPDGGTRAWLVAAGAACIFFSAMGYSNSFGAFQEYYQTHQLSDHSPDDIAWIGSVSAFLMFASGAIGGPLFDRYGVKVSSNLFVHHDPGQSGEIQDNPGQPKISHHFE